MLSARDVFYLKLGRGGTWADDSLANARARIGWKETPLGEIHAGAWTAIRTRILSQAKTLSSGTADANALELFCRSTEEDLWITLAISGFATCWIRLWAALRTACRGAYTVRNLAGICAGMSISPVTR